MPLQAGTKLGVFEVTAQIGAGGMGEVYRAHDTTLDRDVAIKVLPDAFATDTERLARFEREAKVLASLNHPNIAAIYGLEKSGETPALVLELVEGPTLQDRIAKGPIPLDEALPIARQMAEALEAAHEQGIIHRDLKPANVKVKEDGTVKVLDFGLAKALQPELSDTEAANSPTMTMTAAATKMGVIMGTAAYMSPEQAKGRQVDKRADIWAFGVVLYEMLTGRQAFGGTDISETLAAVLMREIDMTALPTDTPASVRRMLRRSVTRDRKNRLADMSMARLEIDEADAAPETPAVAVATSVAQPALWQRPVSVAAIALGAALVASLTVWSLKPPAAIPIVRMPIPLGADENFTNTGRHAVAISPDGTQIVYSANGGLTLRPVDHLEATPIAGTQGGQGAGSAREPFFSPDGQWIGYEAGGQLRKVAISGGAPITLGEGAFPYGASWGADDTILYGRGSDGIWQVSGAGGTPTQLIAVEDRELAHGPQMLPGSEAVLYTVAGSGWDAAQIVVEQLATGDRTVLIDGGRDGRYLATGHLVYVLNGVLFAVPFDPASRAVTGGPVSLVEGIRDGQENSGAAHFSVADTGALVYIPGEGSGEQFELVWVDRTGQIEPVGAESRDYGWARVSPDGTRLAVDIVSPDGNFDIWVSDLARGTLTRLTFDEARDASPLWSPDGSRVVFLSTREGEGGLFWKAADGTGEVERLLESTIFVYPYGWTADGRVVVERRGNIGVVTTEGDGTLELLLDSEFFEGNPAISPDGRWIAYRSDESGRSEIYVQPFPDLDGKWQVSVEGGREPVWAPDGRELFFITAQGQFWATPVETEPTFRPLTPEALFDLAPFDDPRGRSWDMAPDGARFIFQRTLGAQVAGETEGLVFVQNWLEELNERVPVP